MASERRGQPYCTNLPASVEEALQLQAREMYDTYVNGNKSTARAMANNIPKNRIAYVCMWFQIYAVRDGDSQTGYAFVCSITA